MYREELICIHKVTFLGGIKHEYWVKRKNEVNGAKTLHKVHRKDIEKAIHLLHPHPYPVYPVHELPTREYKKSKKRWTYESSVS